MSAVDSSTPQIRAWNSNSLPVSEPGLLELVQKCRSSSTWPEIDLGKERAQQNLYFSTEIEVAIARSDLIFLCVDTPASNRKADVNASLCLSNLKEAISHIGKAAIKDFILVQKCTVPCGTERLITRILNHTMMPGIRCEILSNPEFLAAGTAVRDLEEPDRVVIGSSDSSEGRSAASVLASLYKTWISEDRIILLDTSSAGLSKLCANALLAQRVSSINSFSMICERVGADVRSIEAAVKRDHRINPHMLDASVGFGGSCFHKDIACLVHMTDSLGLDQAAHYWRMVLDINQIQKDAFARRISERLQSSHHQGLDVALLGFAFKEGTADVRSSPAIDIARHLLKNYFRIRIYDPIVSKDTIWSVLQNEDLSEQDLEQSLEVCTDPYQTCQRSRAIVVLTRQKEFPMHCGSGETPDMPHSRFPLDWKRIAQSMFGPSYVFDGMNVVDDAVSQYGFRVERIGKTATESM